MSITEAKKTTVSSSMKEQFKPLKATELEALHDLPEFEKIAEAYRMGFERGLMVKK